MDLKSIPKDKQIYMTYRTTDPYAFTETNDLAIVSDIIKYPIANVANDAEFHGTLFIGDKRYANSDAYQILGHIMTIAMEHKKLMETLLYNDLKPNQNLAKEQEQALHICNQNCKKFGIIKEDVITCLDTFDALFAKYQTPKTTNPPECWNDGYKADLI
jgi:hypothetical protein